MAKLSPVETLSAELLVYGGALVCCAGKLCIENPSDVTAEVHDVILELTLALARFQEAMQYH